jgi:HlyD family secretion protein
MDEVARQDAAAPQGRGGRTHGPAGTPAPGAGQAAPAFGGGFRQGPGGRRFWLIGALLSLLVVVAIAAAWWIFSSGPAVHYATAPVSRGAVSHTVIATGTVNPELTIIVGTYVSGVIQEVHCDYNTKVTKGQLCARIDPRPYQTIVDQNKANLAVARAQQQKDEAQLTYAKSSLDRAAQLIQHKAISEDSYDSAKNAFDQAAAQVAFDKATIQQRQAALDAAQVNLDYTNIVSPVDGVVVSRSVTVGQTVAASFQTPTLFLIATDLTKMQVDTNVSESDIGDVKDGDKVSFNVDAFPGRTFQGTVTQVRQSPQTVQNVVTYDVVVSANNADLSLKPGMTAATRIIVDQRDNVLRVPNAALRFVPGGFAAGRQATQKQVWVLRDGEPTAVPVSAGLAGDSFTEIQSGELKPGDQVITAEQAATSGRTVIPRLRL